MMKMQFFFFQREHLSFEQSLWQASLVCIGFNLNRTEKIKTPENENNIWAFFSDLIFEFVGFFSLSI